MVQRCGHPTSTGPGTCGRQIPDDADACFMHSGAGTPPRHGAPAGNDNAVGNDGGGAPAGNGNAMIHGGFADLELFASRLDAEETEWVEWFTEEIVKKAEATAPEMDDDERERLARRYTLLSVQADHAQADLINCEEGRGFGVERKVTTETDDGEVTISTETVNPAFHASRRIRQRERRIGRKLNLFSTS